MNRDYIPSNPSDRNSWIENLYTAVLADAVAWGIPAAQITSFTAFRVRYLLLYGAYSVPGTRTQQQSIDYRNFMRTEFVPFLRSFTQGFVVNNSLIPIGTRAGLGLNPRGLNPRKAKPVIKVFPTVGIKPLGGGKVSFGFTPSGNKRTGILPEADGVLLYTRLVVRNTPPPVVINDGTTETDPPSLQGFDCHYSTKALFSIQYDRLMVGSTLEVYARWSNSSDPAKNGPFTSLFSLVIS